MKTKAIRELRKSHGLDQDREWDIWRDGCEDGEYVPISLQPLLKRKNSQSKREKKKNRIPPNGLN